MDPNRAINTIPYPAIERHGVIGDRRTAALTAADGTIDWLCLPDYDGDILFGAILDWRKGGAWRLGPAAKVEGEQSYDGETMVLRTEWQLDSGQLVLRDVMLRPQNDRTKEQEPNRALIRVLSCAKGKVRCRFEMKPGYNLSEQPEIVFADAPGGTSITISGALPLRLSSNFPLSSDASTLWSEVELAEGQEVWSVLELSPSTDSWSTELVQNAVEENRNYWKNWLQQIHCSGPGLDMVRRSAMVIHLLSYAPSGSGVAAATTSLPERIGGGWNADYRLSWVRDTSLALGMLERLGDWQETERYLQWLATRQSRFGKPFQVLYGIRGEKRPRQRELAGAAGYRGSTPVRVGNHAYKQFQLGSLAFLSDCLWLYLQENGAWQKHYWKAVQRLADYTLKNWREPDNGIWELPVRRQFVYSKVLSWVAVDRAIRIARKVAPEFDTSHWEAELPKIHEEVMQKGWSEQLGAFRQCYESDALDSATLLISVLDFLPGDHPRVLATIDRISERLTINGFVYRFDPGDMPEFGDWPLGQWEGAFLPCTFWLATAYAKVSQRDKAEALLRRTEGLAGKLGLFAEGVDPRDHRFLGNTPLLFSHVEYVRAKLELLDRNRNA